ncbi:MAG TPA: polysaccharide biosynthesis/export family protein [Pyrinomonadaceae bacterium]|nr:polysaccharide biosynthesis/export family protein [Pyrinomonadaceae bacterium]
MNQKTLVILCLVFVCGAVFTVLAQNPAETTPRTVQTSSVDDQGVGRYPVGPGDILDVRVFGQADLNSTVEVDSDGNITSLPFIETPIPAKCRSEREIQASITEAYAKYLIKPRVSVLVKERRSRPPAVIMGAVRNAQRVDMRRRVRLHELLPAAGGTTQTASGTIQIMHTEPEMCTEPVKNPAAPATSDVGQLQVYQLADVKAGLDKADPVIRPGDIVIVTEGDPIYITGAVVQPREMVLKDGLTLARAIMTAGGATRQAKTSEVHIYRKTSTGSDDIKVNFEEIKRGKEKDVPLQAYDIVEVRTSSPWSAKNLGDFFLNSVKSASTYLPTMIFY